MVKWNKFGSNFNLPQQNQSNEELEKSASQEHKAIGKQEGKELSYDHIRKDPKYRVAKLEIRRNKKYSPNALMNVLKLRSSQLKEFEAALVDEGFLEKQEDNTYWINATELRTAELQKLNTALAQIESGSLGSGQVSQVSRQVELGTEQRPGLEAEQVDGQVNLEQVTERRKGLEADNTTSGQEVSSQSEPIGRQQESQARAYSGLQPEAPKQQAQESNENSLLSEARKKVEEVGILDAFNDYVVRGVQELAAVSPAYLENEGFAIIKELSEQSGLFFTENILKDLTRLSLFDLVDKDILEFNNNTLMLQLGAAEQGTGVIEIKDGDTAILEEQNLTEENTALHAGGTDPYAAVETQHNEGFVDPFGETGTMAGLTEGGTAQYGEQQDTQQNVVDAEEQEGTIVDGVPAGTELNPAEDEEDTFVGTAPDLNIPNDTQENPAFEPEPATPERDLTLDNFEFQKPESIEAYLNLMQTFPIRDIKHVNAVSLKNNIEFGHFLSSRYGLVFTEEALMGEWLIDPDDESGYSLGLEQDDFEDIDTVQALNETYLEIANQIKNSVGSIGDITNVIGELSRSKLNELQGYYEKLQDWANVPDDEKQTITQGLESILVDYRCDELDTRHENVANYINGWLEKADEIFEVEDEDRIERESIHESLENISSRVEAYIESIEDIDLDDLYELLEDLNHVLVSCMSYNDLTAQEQQLFNKVLEDSKILGYSNENESVAKKLLDNYVNGIVQQLDDEEKKWQVTMFSFVMEELSPYYTDEQLMKYGQPYRNDFTNVLNKICDGEFGEGQDDDIDSIREEILRIKERIESKMYNELDQEYQADVVEVHKESYQSFYEAYKEVADEVGEALGEGDISADQRDALEASYMHVIENELERLRTLIGTATFDEDGVDTVFQNALNHLRIEFVNAKMENDFVILEKFLTPDKIQEKIANLRLEVEVALDESKQEEGGYDPNNLQHVIEFNNLLADKIDALLNTVSIQAVQKVLINWEDGINAVKNEKFRQILLGYIESHFAAHSTEDLKFDSAYSVFEEGTGPVKEKKIGFSLDPNGIEFDQREKYLELFKKDFQGESFEVFLAQETEVFKEYESLESQLNSAVSQIENLTTSPKYIPRTEAIVRELRGKLRPHTADGSLPDVKRFKGITAAMFLKDGLPTNDIRLRTAYLGELRAVVRIMNEKLQDLVELNREQDNIRRAPEIVSRLQAIQTELETKTLTDTQRVALDIEREELLASLRVIAPGEFNKIEMENLQDLVFADYAVMAQDATLVDTDQHAELLQSLQLVESNLWNEDPTAYLELKIKFTERLIAEKEDQKNNAVVGSPEEVALIHEITQLENDLQHWKSQEQIVEANENSREKTHEELKVSVDSLQNDIVAGSNTLKILMAQMIDGSITNVDGIPIVEVLDNRMAKLQEDYNTLKDILIPRLGYENVQNEGFKHYDRKAKDLVYALKDAVSQFRAEIATTQVDLMEADKAAIQDTVEDLHTMFAEARGLWVQNRVSRIEELNKDLTKSIILEELKARNLKGIKNPDSAANSLVNGAREWGNSNVTILGIKMKMRTALALGAGCTPVVPMATAFVGSFFAGPAGASVGWTLGSMASAGVVSWSGYESFRGQPEKLLDSNRGLEQMKKDYKVEDLFFKLQNTEAGAGGLIAQHPTFDFLRKIEAVCVENQRDPETVEEYKVLHKYVHDRLKKFEDSARLSSAFSGETTLPQSVVDNYIANSAEILSQSDEKYLQELDKAAAGSSTKRAALAAIALGSVTGVMNLGATVSVASAVKSMLVMGGYSAAVNISKTKKTKSQRSNDWNVWDVLFNKSQPKPTRQVAAEGLGAAARGTANVLGAAGQAVKDRYTNWQARRNRGF